MNKHIRSLLDKLALVSLTAGISSAIVLHQVERTIVPPERTTITTERLEIVDKDGKPCVVLQAGEYGGSIRVFRPSKGEGSKGLLFFVGTIFEDFVQLSLHAPSGAKFAKDSESMLTLSLSGSFSTPTFSALNSRGKPIFQLGNNNGPDDQTLKLRRPNEKTPYYAK